MKNLYMEKFVEEYLLPEEVISGRISDETTVTISEKKIIRRFVEVCHFEISE